MNTLKSLALDGRELQISLSPFRKEERISAERLSHKDTQAPVGKVVREIQIPCIPHQDTNTRRGFSSRDMCWCWEVASSTTPLHPTEFAGHGVTATVMYLP